MKYGIIIGVFLAWSCTNPSGEGSGSAGIPAADTASLKIDTSGIDTFSGFSSDTIVPPYQYSVLQKTDGDLDGDGIKERVVVYNTSIETDEGTKRVLKIYKFQDSHWMEFGTCENCIMSSQLGGRWGDPFQDIEINKGRITIFHQGGGVADEWSYEHQFKMKDSGWYLIGVTTENFTRCDYLERHDFDLLKNRISYKKQMEKCNAQGELLGKKNIISRVFKQQASDSLSFDFFKVGVNRVELPDTFGVMHF